MHRLEKIEIKGFWGNHSFETAIHPDVTFLIGANGTGKTTLINLIAAVLVCDFQHIDQTDFSSIEITLSSISGKKKPSISVTKKSKSRAPFPEIQYAIKKDHSENPTTFALDQIAEQLMLRGRDFFHRSYRDILRHQTADIAGQIQEMIPITWLTIHRTAPSYRFAEERNPEPAVDKKIEQIIIDLVKYFSSLSKQKDEEIRKFQEFIFLSLIDKPKAQMEFKRLPEDGLEKQKMELVGIFKELHVKEELFENILEEYFKNAKKIVNTSKNTTQVDELITRAGLDRISKIIEEWQRLQNRLSDIFKQQDQFLTIIDSLFQRKKVQLNNNNELFFLTRSNKSLTPQMLSSGEKQMFILLGEALLQRNKPYLYIADEPELSLHVSWQEKLIANIKTLNSKAQILVATHSPDIVGALSDRAIDMESLIP